MGDQMLNRSFDQCWGEACTVMIQLSMAIIDDRFWPIADILLNYNSIDNLTEIIELI